MQYVDGERQDVSPIAQKSYMANMLSRLLCYVLFATCEARMKLMVRGKPV
jgi:hypothetical protein